MTSPLRRPDPIGTGRRSLSRVTVHEVIPDHVERVLAVVELIPAGRVMSYGDIAEYIQEHGGRASARSVGTVMSRYGGVVAWHRVVAGNGRLVPGHELEARQRLLSESVPFRGDRVDMAAARWWPPPAA